MPALAYILIALAAYLLGSVPTGFLVARAKGVDIRTVGSGNIGATNAMRALDRPLGIFVLLMDALKGFAAAQWLPLLCLRIYHVPETHDMAIMAGICAVVGHNYTCWLRFKGGKGIATSAGVYLALAPWPLLIAVAVFVLTILITRYVSLGSILAAVALTVAVWILSPDNLLLGVVTTALCALAIYKHKSNIQRLMAGTENRMGNNSKTKEERK